MDKLVPFTEKRPWGEYRKFTDNEPSTVKLLLVRKGQCFSLQEHFHRKEFWKVLSGNPEVIIGDETLKARSGDEFEVPTQTKHRISAPIDDVRILEISFGKFDESDIIRQEDKYGRS